MSRQMRLLDIPASDNNCVHGTHSPFNPKPGTDRRLVRRRFVWNSRHSAETRTPSACG